MADTKIIAAVIAVVMLAAGIFIGNSISGYYTYRIDTDMLQIDSLSTEGFTEVDVDLNLNELTLTGDCRQISMAISPDQAYSIDMALRKMEGIRPLTHDLMDLQMEVFGIEVVIAKIHTLEEGAYYADLILKQDNRVLTIDARPSDAIALAIRARAPIYVSDSLMEDEGVAAC
jgi:bifunctional DNase/RNase